MARSPYVWGIDIGRCGLKAMRGRIDPADPRKLVAEGFDYIEYPMLLSQPEADPVELVRAALEEFLGRNDVGDDRVVLAVPGQMGLAKFIKLPPIEAKKIPDIVKYEARQQIPFPMEQVVWDWQRLPGGFEEGGFVMDAEVALFAMKREQVYKALAPLEKAGVQVELLQLSPIALANMLLFDQLPPADTLDPDDPPPSTVLVSMGVDTTDLVVTNGLRLWQRSMPIGGNAFTKALVSEMKLTFAKAETLKRNAVRAEDPKAVFKAMRPVFQEFAADLQRSLNYFTSADRTAKIGRVLLLGNAAKLRGLSDFVGKQLGLDVQRLENFKALEGANVLAAPAFRENRMAFGTAYGLALQGAGGAALRTNLMPPEIIRDRLVNEKKPWAVAAMVGLLLAGLANFLGIFMAWQSYDLGQYSRAFAAADSAKARSSAAIEALASAKQKRDEAMARQRQLVTLQDRRFQAIELFRAVTAFLPHDQGEPPEHPADRLELEIDSLDMEHFPDLATWFTGVKARWERDLGREKAPADDATPADGAAEADETAASGQEGDGSPGGGPQGPGWVVQIAGHHFHNEDRHKPEVGEEFVRSTLLRGLAGLTGPVTVAAGTLSGEQVPVKELGIGYPVIVVSSPFQTISISTGAGGSEATGMGPGGRPGRGEQPGFGRLGPGRTGMGPPGMAGRPGTGQRPGATPLEPDDEIQVKRYDFVIQFAWQPRSPGGSPPPATEAAAP
jgi:type IV pilus assembly protein PilM